MQAKEVMLILQSGKSMRYIQYIRDDLTLRTRKGLGQPFAKFVSINKSCVQSFWWQSNATGMSQLLICKMMQGMDQLHKVAVTSRA